MTRAEQHQFNYACDAMAAGRYGDALELACQNITADPSHLNNHALLWEIARRCRAAGGPLPAHRAAHLLHDELLRSELEWLQAIRDADRAKRFVVNTYRIESDDRSRDLSRVRAWAKYCLAQLQENRTAA